MAALLAHPFGGNHGYRFVLRTLHARMTCVEIYVEFEVVPTYGNL
jgi:hypothetical protein